MAKAVLFDLDGTLHDRQAGLLSFLADQWRRFPALQGIPLPRFAQRFLELDNNGRRWKDAVYADFGRTLNLSADVQTQLLDDYLETFPRHARAFPGVAQALTALRSKEFALGLVTNGRDDMQRSVIAALDLGPLLDTILVSQSEGVRKPDPAIFLRALDRLEAMPEHTVFVGDDPDADIRGAAAVGLKTIWKTTPGVTAPVDDATSAVLHEFSALPALVESLITDAPRPVVARV